MGFGCSCHELLDNFYLVGGFKGTQQKTLFKVRSMKSSTCSFPDWNLGELSQPHDESRWGVAMNHRTTPTKNQINGNHGSCNSARHMKYIEVWCASQQHLGLSLLKSLLFCNAIPQLLEFDDQIIYLSIYLSICLYIYWILCNYLLFTAQKDQFISVP